jgi:CheY-like chemotaxis protein
MIILMAEDDPDDRALMMEAFRQSRLAGELRMVASGEELLDYLYNRGIFENKQNAPTPHLILLDLNLPGLNALELLVEIKGDSMLRRIPVVVLSASQDRQDVVRSYSVGASSYITKPQGYDDLVKIIGLLGKYWLEVAELPS